MNKLCEMCKEIEIPNTKRNKYCSECKKIKVKESRDKQNKKNAEKRSTKKRKILDGNFNSLNLEGIDLLPDNFSKKSPINYYSYCNHFKNSWCNILKYYGKLENLIETIKIEYLKFINETGSEDLNLFTKHIGTSMIFLSHLDVDGIRKSVGVNNQNTSEETRVKNFFEMVEKIGRLPYTIKQFNDSSSITFDTYINWYGNSNYIANIEFIVSHFISHQDFLIYQEDRREYLISSQEKRTRNRTGRYIYSDEELKERAKTSLDFYVKEFDTVPTFKEFNRLSRLGGRTLRKRLDMTYLEFILDLGYEPEQGYSTEKIVVSSVSQIVNESPITQATFEWLTGHRGWGLRCDAYFPENNFILEYDGEFHFYPIEGLGGKESFERMQKNDAIKNVLIPKHGIKLVRISYDEPYWDIDFLRMRLVEHGLFPRGYTEVSSAPKRIA